MTKPIGSSPPLAQDMSLRRGVQDIADRQRASVPGRLQDAYEKGGYVGFNRTLQKIQEESGIINLLLQYAQANSRGQIKTAEEALKD